VHTTSASGHEFVIVSHGSAVLQRSFGIGQTRATVLQPLAVSHGAASKHGAGAGHVRVTCSQPSIFEHVVSCVYTSPGTVLG
jgi:hypothetical protein